LQETTGHLSDRHLSMYVIHAVLSKGLASFQHYPILNDRLAFVPNPLNVPYVVRSSNTPLQTNTQDLHYLCGSHIENLKGSTHSRHKNHI